MIENDEKDRIAGVFFQLISLEDSLVRTILVVWIACLYHYKVGEDGFISSHTCLGNISVIATSALSHPVHVISVPINGELDAVLSDV